MGYITVAALSPPKNDRASWAVSVLQSAMAAGVAPVLLPAQTGALVRFSIKAPPALADWMRRNCPANMSLGEAAGGWIEAVRAQTLGRPISPVSTDAPPAAWLAQVNPDLHVLAERAASAMAGGQVIAAEAATGTGKGRMLAALAWREVGAGQRVVIATPLGLARQLLDELALLAPAGADLPVLLLGRQNFVDPARLWSFAEALGHRALMQWIDGGGQPVTPGTRALASRMAGELAWLLEDAMAVAEADADSISGFLLNEDAPSDCPARQVYEASRSAVAGGRLLVCSHQFLAADVRLWMLQGQRAELAGPDEVVLLPRRLDRLLVDEAHLLEPAFAQVFSGAVHLHAARRRAAEWARSPKEAGQALGELERVVADLAGGAGVGLAQDFPALVHAAGAAAKALAGRGAAGLQALRADVEVLDAVAQGGRCAVTAEVTPIRHYAVLSAGRDNLDSVFASLWGRVGGAALVSATLYGVDGQASALRLGLNVPAARFAMTAPVIPGWIYEPVTLAQPALGVMPDDSPAWLDALAGLVAAESERACGGVLVLLTSYAAVAGLAERLSVPLGERLIVQGGDLPGAACADRFRSAQRPVWLGVGYAWTGVDLSDKAVAAADDRVLETLIMPRVPFGANRTLTHQRRVRRLGFPVEVAAAAVMFRQGLGRLVRRRGMQGKRLVICDDRLQPGGAHWASIFGRLLGRYRRER